MASTFACTRSTEVAAWTAARGVAARGRTTRTAAATLTASTANSPQCARGREGLGYRSTSPTRSGGGPNAEGRAMDGAAAAQGAKSREVLAVATAYATRRGHI